MKYRSSKKIETPASSARSARQIVAHGVSRGRDLEQTSSPRSGRKNYERVLSVARYAGSRLVWILTHGLRRGLRSAALRALLRFHPRPPSQTLVWGLLLVALSSASAQLASSHAPTAVAKPSSANTTLQPVGGRLPG